MNGLQQYLQEDYKLDINKNQILQLTAGFYGKNATFVLIYLINFINFKKKSYGL